MTLDDLVDGVWFPMRSLRILVTAIGIAAVVGGALLTITRTGWIGPGAIAYGLVDLALVQFRPLQRLLLRRRVVALVGKTCEVVLSEHGLTYQQPDSNATFAWSSITGTKEDSHILAVVSGGVIRMGIPKRAFSSDQEAAEFRAELARHIEAVRTP